MAGQLPYHIACLRDPVCHVSRQRIGVSVHELDEIVFADIERFLREALANKELIYGFGHAVLRAEDPRATIQYGLGEKICGDDPLFRTAATMREVAVRVLLENPKISNPYPNVDAISGTLLNATGLTDSDYYTVLFGLSRVVGISAQIVDERLNLRGGKGTPIYRCSFKAENQERSG